MLRMAPPFTTSGLLSARALRQVAAAVDARERFNSPGGLTHGDVRVARGPWGQQIRNDAFAPFFARITETGYPVVFTGARIFRPTDPALVIEDELPAGLVPPFDLRVEGGGEVFTVVECRPVTAGDGDGDLGASGGFAVPDDEESGSPGDTSPGDSEGSGGDVGDAPEPDETDGIPTIEPPITSAAGTICVVRRWLQPHLSDDATKALLDETDGAAAFATPRHFPYQVGQRWEVPGTTPYGWREQRQDHDGGFTTHSEGRDGSLIWKLDDAGERVSPLVQTGTVIPVYEVNGEPLTPGDVVQAWQAFPGADYYLCERLTVGPLWLRVSDIAPSHASRRKLTVDKTTLAIISVEGDWTLGRPRASNRTTLTADVAPDATTIRVDGNAANFGDFPLATQFYIGINNEVLRVTRRQTPNIWEVVRQQWGSTPNMPVRLYELVDGIPTYTNTTWTTHRAGDQVHLYDGQGSGASLNGATAIAEAVLGFPPNAPTSDLDPPLFSYQNTFDANQQQVYGPVANQANIQGWPAGCQGGQILSFNSPEPLTFFSTNPSNTPSVDSRTIYGVWQIRFDVPTGITFVGHAPGSVIVRGIPATTTRPGIVSTSAQSFRGSKWVDGMLLGHAGTVLLSWSADGPGFFGSVMVSAYNPGTSTSSGEADGAMKTGNLSVASADVSGTLTAGQFNAAFDAGVIA